MGSFSDESHTGPLTTFRQRYIRSTALRLYRRIYAYFNHEPIWLNQRESLKKWSVGDYSYGHAAGSPHVVYYGEPVQLVIGKFCSFAQNVWLMLGAGNHCTEWVTTYPFSFFHPELASTTIFPPPKGDIIIGNDVWIGLGAMILSNTRIGDGAVVAAHSVVTKPVPDYAVVAGNPARIVKMRFSPEAISKLQQIQWWNWTLDRIMAESPTLLSPNVEHLFKKSTTTVPL